MSDNGITRAALGALAEALDADVAAGRTGPVPLLVRAEGPLDGEPALAARPLDAHPGELLLGFDAPPEWSILGVVAEGWATDLAPERTAVEGAIADGSRASRASDRRRVRITQLVARTGEDVAVVAVEGRPPRSLDGGEGLLADVLRRCLGLATAPPGVGVGAFFGSSWLAEVDHHLRVQRAKASWRELERLHPAMRLLASDPTCRNVRLDDAARAFHKVCGWDELRWQVVSGSWLVAGVAPELAAWMDEGAFARHVLARQPRPADLLRDITSSVPASVARKIRGALRSWDVHAAFGQPRADDAA